MKQVYLLYSHSLSSSKPRVGERHYQLYSIIIIVILVTNQNLCFMYMLKNILFGMVMKQKPCLSFQLFQEGKTPCESYSSIGTRSSSSPP